MEELFKFLPYLGGGGSLAGVIFAWLYYKSKQPEALANARATNVTAEVTLSQQYERLLVDVKNELKEARGEIKELRGRISNLEKRLIKYEPLEI